jgi:hypothetical protein
MLNKISDCSSAPLFGTRGSEVRILSLRPIKSIGWRCGRSVAEQFPNRLNVKRATASESIGRPTARHDAGGSFTIHCAGQHYVLPDDLPEPLGDLARGEIAPGRGRGARRPDARLSRDGPRGASPRRRRTLVREPTIEALPAAALELEARGHVLPGLGDRGDRPGDDPGARRRRDLAGFLIGFNSNAWQSTNNVADGRIAVDRQPHPERSDSALTRRSYSCSDFVGGRPATIGIHVSCSRIASAPIRRASFCQ